MDLFLVDTKMKDLRVEIITPNYRTRTHLSHFPETVLINKSLRNITCAVFLDSEIMEFHEMDLETGRITKLNEIEGNADLSSFVRRLRSETATGVIRHAREFFRNMNLLKKFVFRKVVKELEYDDSTSEIPEFDVKTEFLTFKKLSTWPAIDRPIIKTSEYLALFLRNSFMNRLLAYMIPIGNQVHVKEYRSEKVIKEYVPYVMRILLNLFYRSGAAKSLIANKMLRYLTVSVGRKFDSKRSASAIQKFISMYNIDMNESEKSEFPSFNEFFYRKLKPGARFVELPGKISSPADCRLLTSSKKEILVKGWPLCFENVIEDDIQLFSACICRLAPQDYHRFHVPLACRILSIRNIDGSYHSVSPISKFNRVLDQNVKVVVELEVARGRIFFIAIGAMLVGSIVITAKEGDFLNQMDELGYFKFGGSCIVMASDFEWEIADEIKGNSILGVETLVRVGMCIEKTMIQSTDQP